MQSRISCFNKTLFRKNLSRFWPLWGLASLGAALFPLALLMQLLNQNVTNVFGQNPIPELNAVYYGCVINALPLLSLFYAVLVAAAVWSYLYNHRSVTLMHTLPIRREGLFVTNFLSGMVMMLLPYVVVGVLMVLISLFFGLLDPAAIGITALCVIGESFFYFATATLAAFVVSNIFALPAVYFLFHFLAVLLDWLMGTFSKGFLFGLSSSYSGTVEYLSPTVFLMNYVGVDHTYEEVARRSGTRWYTDSILVDVQLENTWVIAVYVCVGVVLLGFAWMLYQRRRSESAGDIIAVEWLFPAFRYGLAALAALAGGLMLYELFWSSFQSGRYYDVLPMVIFMALAGLAGYYAGSMLLEKSFRVFRSRWKGSILVLAGCVVLCAMLHFDLFRISQRVPDLDQVTSVTFYAADNEYIFDPDSEGALLQQVRAVHQNIVENADYARERSDAVYYRYGDESIEGTYARSYITFTYQLKNGLQLNRTYRLAISRNRINEPGTYDYLLDHLVNSQEMRRKRLHAGDSRYTIESGSIYLEKRRESFEFSSREAAELLEALSRDAAAGTWGTYDWFDTTRAFDYAISMDLTFEYPVEGQDYSRNDWLTIRLRPGMENTIACLRGMGYLLQEDLITYAELYPDDYADEVAYYYEEYGYSEITDAAIGVIGGADGPTAIVTTTVG